MKGWRVTAIVIACVPGGLAILAMLIIAGSYESSSWSLIDARDSVFIVRFSIGALLTVAAVSMPFLVFAADTFNLEVSKAAKIGTIIALGLLLLAGVFDFRTIYFVPMTAFFGFCAYTTYATGMLVRSTEKR